MRPSALLLVLVPLIVACSSAGGAPSEPVSWRPGKYVLEASISNAGGVSQLNQYRAELVVESGGAMTMSSLSGLCYDPALTQAGQDQARGQRTFRCGEESYRVRPGAGGVIGDVVAPIEVETVVTECVRYTTNAQGQQVCAETRERVVRTTKQVRAQLRVRTEG